MPAFDAGELNQDHFGKRVRELGDRTASLVQRRAELSAAATATFDDRMLRRIAADLRRQRTTRPTSCGSRPRRSWMGCWSSAGAP